MNARLGKENHVLPVLGLLVGALAVGMAVAETEAGPENDITHDPDTEIFVGLSSQYFGQDPEQVRRWDEQCENPDDLIVALYLAHQTGKSPAFMLTLYGSGVSWWDISTGMAVDPEVWFLPVKYQPRPPFGQVYDLWRSSRESEQPLVLTDADCRNLVAARLLFENFNVSMARAMEIRATGGNLKGQAATEYRNGNGKEEPEDKKVAEIFPNS